MGFGSVGKPGRHKHICPAATVLCLTTLYLLAFTSLLACRSVLFCDAERGRKCMAACNHDRKSVSYIAVVGDPFETLFGIFLCRNQC